MPANRTAALATFIAGLAGCATSLAGAWPNGATAEIALIAGGVATIAGPIAHIIGSWLWDRTPAGQGAATPAVEHHHVRSTDTP